MSATLLLLCLMTLPTLSVTFLYPKKDLGIMFSYIFLGWSEEVTRLLSLLPLSLLSDLKLLAGYKSSRSKLYSDFFDPSLFSRMFVAKSSINWSWDDKIWARCLKLEVIPVGFFFTPERFSIFVKSFITFEVLIYDDVLCDFELLICGDCLV